MTKISRCSQGTGRRRSKHLQKLEAKKAPLYLEHLLQQVPDTLIHVPHSTLNTLLTSSRALRSQVHGFVTTVTISDEKDAKLLASTSWPCLRSLHLSLPDSIQPENMQHLCCNSWQTLTTLDLDDVRLDLPCLLLLVQGNWPSLERLFLAHTDLSDERMAVLQQGKWPRLKCLDLSDCSMGSASVAHLMAAPWKKLQSLISGGNSQAAVPLCQLSKTWPQMREYLEFDYHCKAFRKPYRNVRPGIDAVQLEAAVTCDNSTASFSYLEDICFHRGRLLETDLEELRQCQWPMLKSFLLRGQSLTPLAHALLSQSQWPLLESLELARITSVGMTHIISAKWPMLRKLMLSSDDLDTLGYAELAKGQWPHLERLCLRECNMTSAGMKELLQGSWPLLKVLDLSCWDDAEDGMQHLLTCDWLNLECIELEYKVFHMRQVLDPENQARLEMTDNLIEDSALIAGGKWPKLQMLNFCDAHKDAVWFYDWGKVDPRGPDYARPSVPENRWWYNLLES